MKKIKITPEQEKELKKYKLCNYFKPLDFFLAIKDCRTNTYENLKNFTPEQFAIILCGWYEVEGNWWSEEYIRQENRQLFESYGRSYGEFKLGDILIDINNIDCVLKHNDSAEAEAYLKGGYIKYIYFIEDRKEILK
jgi:hypothetical protein